MACCSRACRNVYTSRLLGGDGAWQPSGEYNPKRNRGPHWRRIRQKYLESIGGRCEGCEAPAVEVHHLLPYASGGNHFFDNLMAVCSECHDNMHAQLRAGAFAYEVEEALCELTA